MQPTRAAIWASTGRCCLARLKRVYRHLALASSLQLYDNVRKLVFRLAMSAPERGFSFDPITIKRETSMTKFKLVVGFVCLFSGYVAAAPSADEQNVAKAVRFCIFTTLPVPTTPPAHAGSSVRLLRPDEQCPALATTTVAADA
uniref:Uncharacterized protein n=1 Tax=Tanacetum cinerariifolium TaxID=118510 RepID=A0A699RKM2_TANCI|nr:hypothetical protein [Tanacetum cinerariifolium]